MKTKYIIMGFLFIILILIVWVLFSRSTDNSVTDRNPETSKPDEDQDNDITNLAPLEKFLSKEEIENLEKELKVFAIRDDSFVVKEKQEYFTENGICFYIWGNVNTYKMSFNVRTKEFTYAVQETTEEAVQKEREASYISFHRYPSEFDYRSLFAPEVPEEIAEIFKSTEITFICFLVDYLGENSEVEGLEIREYEVDPTARYVLGFNMELTGKAGNKTVLTTVFNRGVYEFREPNTDFPLYTSNSEVEVGLEW